MRKNTTSKLSPSNHRYLTWTPQPQFWDTKPSDCHHAPGQSQPWNFHTPGDFDVLPSTSLRILDNQWLQTSTAHLNSKIQFIQSGTTSNFGDWKLGPQWWAFAPSLCRRSLHEPIPPQVLLAGLQRGNQEEPKMKAMIHDFPYPQGLGLKNFQMSGFSQIWPFINSHHSDILMHHWCNCSTHSSRTFPSLSAVNSSKRGTILG